MKIAAKKRGRPRSAIDMKPVTLSIPEEVWERWKEQATKEHTTMSELAVRLVTKYLSRKKGA
jgi:hypothetical protein